MTTPQNDNPTKCQPQTRQTNGNNWINLNWKQFCVLVFQALKFESYHNSPLAHLLLETSCKSIRFAHQFFWYVAVCVCAWVCECMCVCVCVCVLACVCVSMCVCVHALCVCVCACIVWVCMCGCARIHVCVCAHVCVYAQVVYGVCSPGSDESHQWDTGAAPLLADTEGAGEGEVIIIIDHFCIVLFSTLKQSWSCCWSLLYSAILHFQADSLRSRVSLHEWLASYIFLMSTKMVYLSAGMAGAGVFCVHHTPMHQFTSCKATYVRCMHV